MAISDEKIRVALTLDAGLMARVDEYCTRYGLSRSGYFASLAAEKLAASDRVADMAAELSERLVREWMDGYTARLESEMEGALTPELLAQVVQMLGEAQH